MKIEVNKIDIKLKNLFHNSLGLTWVNFDQLHTQTSGISLML